MGLDTTSVVGWSFWIGFFLLWEGRGLWMDHKAGKQIGTTLSELVWTVFATKKGTGKVTGSVRARRFALLAILAWLVVHFVSGGQIA